MDLFYNDYWYIAIIVGLIAGFIDSIAGGGGLITIPALIAMGLSPGGALATNKLQASLGTLSSSIKFFSSGIVSIKSALPTIMSAFCGAVSGAILIQLLDDQLLLILIPMLIVLFAIYFFIFSPNISKIKTRCRIGNFTFALTAGIGIGFYDGFLGPGTGSFFCLALITLQGHNLVKSVAHAKLLNLASNIGALSIFLLGDNIIWSVGLLMGGGQLVGAWFGSHAVLINGTKIVKPLIILVLVSIFTKLALSIVNP